MSSNCYSPGVAAFLWILPSAAYAMHRWSLSPVPCEEEEEEGICKRGEWRTRGNRNESDGCRIRRGEENGRRGGHEESDHWACEEKEKTSRGKERRNQRRRREVAMLIHNDSPRWRLPMLQSGRQRLRVTAQKKKRKHNGGGGGVGNVEFKRSGRVEPWVLKSGLSIETFFLNH